MSVRALTYVEMDLDTYRVTHFEDVQPAQPARNWDIIPGITDASVRGVVQATFPSGLGISVSRPETGTASYARWTFQSPPNVSVIALLRSEQGQIEPAIVLRATDGVDHTGYRLVADTANILIVKTVAGVDTVLMNLSFLIIQGEDIWMRFDAIGISGGVLLRGIVWRGALNDEPSAFMISVEDTTSPLTAAGRVGVYIPEEASETRCGFFRMRSLFGSLIEMHRHALPTSYLPVRDIQATPDVTSISFDPVAISLGSNLGKRALVTVKFSDHPGTDLGELASSGSYWGKFRARKLFRRGQPIRIIHGALGQDLIDMEQRHYILESFSGPSRDGSFTVIGQDVLKLADSDRSQAPRISNGSLLAAIDADDVSATLVPSGIGNAEYPASGIVAIGGSEICTFTRSGDTLTIVRGQHGTVGVSHDEEDRVQLCLDFTAQTPAFIINHLFTQYAEMDQSFIVLADWEAECEAHLQRLYTRLIAEPTGVNKLVSELIEQAGLVIWPDDIANKIRLQVLRGISTQAHTYDETTTLAGSIQSQEQPSTRITQIWTYYGVRNVLESLEEPNNYRSTLATIDTEGESLHGQAVIRKVFGTWIPAFGQLTAQRVNDIQIGRFSTPPRRITFAVMRDSNVPHPELGGGYRIAWNNNQDELGEMILAPIQVTRVNPGIDRIEAEAEEMLFQQFDPEDLEDRVIRIDSNINNIHLPSLHNSIFPPITEEDVYNEVTLKIIVAANVSVGSNNVGVPAFNVGEASDWPAGLIITLEIELNGRVQGAGGQGAFAAGSIVEAVNGGTALYTRFPVILISNGLVWAGAGGGGLAVSGLFTAAGGGGAGTVPGLGGPGTGTDINIGGQPGTPNLGGSGATNRTAVAGKGGDPGQAGQNGSGTHASTVGGVAGNAVDGNSHVTYTLAGDIRGPQVN